jgi:hypothetical protein
MARLSVCVSGGYITADIEANGAVLEAALEQEKAEPVMRCAVLMTLSALAEGGPWPNAVLEAMAAFMARMNNEVAGEPGQARTTAGLRVAPAEHRRGHPQRRTGLIGSGVATAARRPHRSGMQDRS